MKIYLVHTRIFSKIIQLNCLFFKHFRRASWSQITLLESFRMDKTWFSKIMLKYWVTMCDFIMYDKSVFWRLETAVDFGVTRNELLNNCIARSLNKFTPIYILNKYSGHYILYYIKICWNCLSKEQISKKTIMKYS